MKNKLLKIGNDKQIEGCVFDSYLNFLR